MRRFIPILILGLASSIAPAQGVFFEDQTDLALEQIREAYIGLANQRSLRFKIEVTESNSPLNARRGTIVGSVVFDSPLQRNVLKLEVLEYSGHQVEVKRLLRRIVADGSKFTIYDAVANSYSVASYAGENRNRQFFGQLEKAAGSGPLSLFSRLITQVYADRYPTFRNWIPGSRFQAAGKKENSIFMILPLQSGGERSVMIASPLVNVIYTDRLGPNPVNSPQTTWNLSLNWNQGGSGNFEFRAPLNAKDVSGD